MQEEHLAVGAARGPVRHGQRQVWKYVQLDRGGSLGLQWINGAGLCYVQDQSDICSNCRNLYVPGANGTGWNWVRHSFGQIGIEVLETQFHPAP